MSPHRRLPISARHAFALAFDLAVRRDPFQSLVVPFLLHAPWAIATLLLPSPDDPGGMTESNLLLNSSALLGETLVAMLVAGMLRFRARSVFNTPAETPPAGVVECYREAFARLPWLFVTEVLRNLATWLASFALFFPGVWLGFRLSLATEAVVLRGGNTSSAFERSYHLTPGRFERWLEMIAMSVALVFSLLLLCAVCFLLSSWSWSTWLSIALLLFPLVLTLVQYAWTFFYLRLEEIEVLNASAGSAGASPTATGSSSAGH